jgi:hypothetical protein
MNCLGKNGLAMFGKKNDIEAKLKTKGENSMDRLLPLASIA